MSSPENIVRTSYKGVPLEVMPFPLGDEDIGFVQQEDTAPFMGKPENIFQFRLHVLSRDTKVTTRNRKQWLPPMLCHCLGSRCFAHPRDSMQENDYFDQSVRDLPTTRVIHAPTPFPFPLMKSILSSSMPDSIIASSLKCESIRDDMSRLLWRLICS